jgi:hypothetical protein
MPSPSYNKWKSSIIHGNLSVRDLTNSAGTSVVEVASTDLSGNFISRGDSTFSKAVSCNGTISNSNHLITKEYLDNAIATGGSVSLSGTNNFTGLNSYNSNFPTSTLPTSTAVTTSSIVNKGMLDILYQSISGMSAYLTTATANSIFASLTGTNTFSGTNSFSNLPTSTATPTISTHLVNKQYVDTNGGNNSLLNNTFTGVNNFDNIVNFRAPSVITTTSVGNNGDIRNFNSGINQWVVFNLDSGTISLNTTQVVNFFMCGAGGAGGATNGSNTIACGGGSGAVIYGTMTLVAGTTYTFTSFSAGGSTFIGGSISITCGNGAVGNVGNTSPLAFTGAIPTATATGLISSTIIPGKPGGVGRNDALTPNGENGTPTPFYWDRPAGSLVQNTTGTFIASAGAGSKSGGFGSTTGGLFGGGVAGGSAAGVNQRNGSSNNNNGGLINFAGCGGGAGCFFTGQPTSGAPGFAGMMYIYFTPSNPINRGIMNGGFLTIPKLTQPALRFTTSAADQTFVLTMANNTIFMRADHNFTIQLPANQDVQDGDKLIIVKVNAALPQATATVGTFTAAPGSNAMISSTGAQVLLPTNTLFGTTVWKIELVAWKVSLGTTRWHVV